MALVLAFNMNGTLLDTSALDPLFERMFPKRAVRREWFNQMIELAMVATITGYYSEFSKLGRAALEMTAARHGVALSENDVAAVLQQVRELPAFPDVSSGLSRLDDAKFRLAVLTNSPLESAEHSLSKAGIRSYFENILSVQMVQRFKPAAEVYRPPRRVSGLRHLK